MDVESFDRFCRDHHTSVVRTVFLITGDRQEAEDLAQEAFARAFERWKTVAVLERPEAWVQRVAANLAVSWWRRAMVRRRAPVAGPGFVEPPELPDLELRQAILQLSPAQRAAIVLRFYADRSIEDVAEALGKRPGTIRALTAQGVARLRVLLGNEMDMSEEVQDEDA
jgi:RNA polymerase sigma-70 factor (ECF subfamily)